MFVHIFWKRFNNFFSACNFILFIKVFLMAHDFCVHVTYKCGIMNRNFIRKSAIWKAISWRYIWKRKSFFYVENIIYIYRYTYIRWIYFAKIILWRLFNIDFCSATERQTFFLSFFFPFYICLYRYRYR